MKQWRGNAESRRVEGNRSGVGGIWEVQVISRGVDVRSRRVAVRSRELSSEAAELTQEAEERRKKQ
jgi:hypothetical protein